MDKAAFVPNIEPTSDACNIETVRMLDRFLVCMVLHDECIEHSVTMIDEMNAIFSHP
jgi:hypothetical protein